MSYMQELEIKFEALLSHMPEGEAAIIIREVKAIALESYRNGQKAGAPASKLPARKRAFAKTGTR